MIRFEGKKITTTIPGIKVDDEGIYGNANFSNYIPFSNILYPLSGDYIDNNTYIYHPLNFSPESLRAISYKRFLWWIFRLTSYQSLKHKKKEEEVEVYFSLGTLFDSKGDILFMLTYNKGEGNLKQEDFRLFIDFIMGKDMSNFRHKNLYEKIHIIVSSEFPYKSPYDTLYTKISKDIFQPLMSLGASVEYTQPSKIPFKVYKSGVNFNIHCMEDLEKITNVFAPEAILHSRMEIFNIENLDYT